MDSTNFDNYVNGLSLAPSPADLPEFYSGTTIWKCPWEWNPPDYIRFYGDPWCYIIKHHPERYILWLFNPESRNYGFLMEGEYGELREVAMKIYRLKEQEFDMAREAEREASRIKWEKRLQENN